MMKKISIGIALGAAAGAIDVAPMIAQGLTWDANVSAFVMWCAIGFFVSISELGLPSPLKGVVIAYAAVAPILVLVGWKQPATLVPIALMTLVLGALLGAAVGRFAR